MVNAFRRAVLSHHFAQWMLVTHVASAPLAVIPCISDETNSIDSSRHKIVRQYSGNVITKWFRMFNLLPGTAAKLHPSAPASLEKKLSSKLLTSLSFRSTHSFRSVADEEFEENSLLGASNDSDNVCYSYIV
ncbi:hypothetical protein EON65_00745 [archaeon]|nr:MAG: hypothetical protein EON65_00745 [archaeon]